MFVRAAVVVASLVAAMLAACAPVGARGAGTMRCADLPAHPVDIAGDLHALWGDGPPAFHLQWDERSALVLADALGFPRDSLLALARQRVRVQGVATADTATICASAVALARPANA